tara:strand:- start:87 stop:311 length:225 start_codon:yes stop_codon:yes gene_type:complete
MTELKNDIYDLNNLGEVNNLGEISFNSQSDILEAHQIMLNQLRTNVIKLANQNRQLYKLVEKLTGILDENNLIK